MTASPRVTARMTSENDRQATSSASGYSLPAASAA